MSIARAGFETRTFALRAHVFMTDGHKQSAPVYRLKSVTVGDVTVIDMLCSIGETEVTPLLGQSFLRMFASWSIDNRRHMLVLRAAPFRLSPSTA